MLVSTEGGGRAGTDIWFDSLEPSDPSFLPLATSAMRSVPEAWWAVAQPWEHDDLLARVVAQAEQHAQVYYDQWERSQRPEEPHES